MIDIHTHLWPAEKTPSYLENYFGNRNKDSSEYKLSCEGILKSMDEAEIEKSVVSAISFLPEWTNKDIMVINNYVLKQCSLSGGRLIPFCTINPLERDSENVLRSLIEDYGFKGLKLHCNMQEFYPNDKNIYPIYKIMEKYQKPILFHSGGIGVNPIKDKFGQPIYFDDVACDFPNLPIILGHAGRIWYNETAMLMRKHKNIYADISTNIGRAKQYKEIPLQKLLNIIKVWGGSTQNLLFGSDYPFYDQNETVKTLHLLLSEKLESMLFTLDEVYNVLNQNVEAFCKTYKLL